MNDVRPWGYSIIVRGDYCFRTSVVVYTTVSNSSRIHQAAQGEEKTDRISDSVSGTVAGKRDAMGRNERDQAAKEYREKTNDARKRKNQKETEKRPAGGKQYAIGAYLRVRPGGVCMGVMGGRRRRRRVVSGGEGRCTLMCLSVR